MYYQYVKIVRVSEDKIYYFHDRGLNTVLIEIILELKEVWL